MTYSYSDMLTFLRCPKKYEYSAIRRLQRRAASVPLTLGIYFHRLMMGHYLGQYDEALGELKELVATAPLINDEILTAQDLLEQAEALVGRYLAKHPDEWEILHVEETFTIRLDSGEEISFTPDLVIRDQRGVWIVDHKTTTSVPRGDLPVGNFQAFLYSAAVRELFPDFKGFIFNYIRKKIPTQPRLTKTGDRRVADINRIDTSYEILRDFVVENAPELMDDAAVRRRLAELKDTDRFFWRQYVFVTDHMADEAMEDAVATIAHIELAGATGRYPRSFLPYSGAQECDNCPFRELCVAELRGYDTEHVMALYEERDMSHRNYDHEEEVLLDAT